MRLHLHNACSNPRRIASPGRNEAGWPAVFPGFRLLSPRGKVSTYVRSVKRLLRRIMIAAVSFDAFCILVDERDTRRRLVHWQMEWDHVILPRFPALGRVLYNFSIAKVKRGKQV